MHLLLNCDGKNAEREGKWALVTGGDSHEFRQFACSKIAGMVKLTDKRKVAAI